MARTVKVAITPAGASNNLGENLRSMIALGRCHSKSIVRDPAAFSIKPPMRGPTPLSEVIGVKIGKRISGLMVHFMHLLFRDGLHYFP